MSFGVPARELNRKMSANLYGTDRLLAVSYLNDSRKEMLVIFKGYHSATETYAQARAVVDGEVVAVQQLNDKEGANYVISSGFVCFSVPPNANYKIEIENPSAAGAVGAGSWREYS